jgi:hypothetical protein
MKINSTNKGITKSTIVLVVLLAIIVIGFIIAKTSSNPPQNSNQNGGSNATSTENSAPITIDQIMNATIPDFIDTSSKATLKFTEGKSTGTTKNPMDARIESTSTSYTYGDINNDGANDLVATIKANTGGTGIFNYLVAFANDKGTPHYIAAALIGDRIQMKKLTIQNGVITAHIITQGPGEAMCCGTMPASVLYRLDGNSLDVIN